MAKTAEAFRTISEVADDLDVPKHVLRFWEVKFPQIRPMKRGGGRRYYRPEDLELLRGIRHLLHAEGYTIKGVQKILREQGVDQVKVHGRNVPEQPEPAARGGRQPSTGRALPNALAGQTARGARARQGRKIEDHAGLLAAIAELDECRRVLRGEQTPAGLAPNLPRQTKARQNRA